MELAFNTWICRYLTGRRQVFTLYNQILASFDHKSSGLKRDFRQNFPPTEIAQVTWQPQKMSNSHEQSETPVGSLHGETSCQAFLLKGRYPACGHQLRRRGGGRPGNQPCSSRSPRSAHSALDTHGHSLTGSRSRFQVDPRPLFREV